MKILLFIDSLGPGGAQRQIVGLASMLKEKDFDVTLLTYHDIPFYQSQLDKAGIENVIVQDNGNHLKRVWRVRECIDQIKPDWVISYLDSPSLIASFWRLLGMKYNLIVSERNTTQWVGRRGKVKFWLYKYADVIVSNSFSQKKFIDNYYPQYRMKSVVIPNFVDLSHFIRDQKRKRDNTVIVVATVWGSKNTLGFIDAVHMLKSRGVSFVVKWYGICTSTPYVKMCLSKIKEYGLEEEFHLLPKTSSIIEAYHGADYFCLPSFFEGTPNALCEAMACGLPILCSDVCDNGIYVKEGVNGFLFDPRSASEMADKIERALLLSDKEYYGYCRNSRETAEESFSKSKFIDAYLDLINCKGEKTCHPCTL